MRIVDSRRLRGPNLQTSGPAALAEVAFEEGEAPGQAVEAWRRELRRMLEALGMPSAAGEARARVYPGGAALTFPAPIDVLLAATEVNEWAIDSAAFRADEPFETARQRLAARLAEEARPILVALRSEASRRGVPFLWDDDAVTLGMARRSRTFGMDHLPQPADVPWHELGRIPTALVTGTNGKTTCTRLVARMAKQAGFVAGNTSTDGIAVDEVVVEEGDWTGPGAARALLRRPEIEIAVLESARGGLLRRGLALDRCDAALVTNVTRDHLGEFGVCDVETMARTKAVVATVVRPDGRIVLNGADPSLVALQPTFRAPTVLFALDPETPAVQDHLRRGGEAWAIVGGRFARMEGTQRSEILPVDEAPIAFGGAALHNVENGLAAAALARALGLPDEAIAAGLRSFTAHDNPGRGQLVALTSGVRVLADFGHNPDAMRHLLALAEQLLSRQEGRLFVVSATPGDRRDEDIAALAREIARARPAGVFVWDMTQHLRGREPGEVPVVMRRALLASGLDEGRVATVEGELDALGKALAEARTGDLVILAPNIDRQGVWTTLREAGAKAEA